MAGHGLVAAQCDHGKWLDDHMQRSHRQKMIIETVRSGGEVSVAGLVQLTGASPITVRRDLAQLQDLGQLVRTHGGARRGTAHGVPRPYAERAEEDPGLKAAMARAAAELIGDGEAVIVDDGTTCAALAGQLAGRPIQALALSLRAAGELAARPGADVVVPGGPVRPVALCFRGAQAVEAVRDFRADVAVLGACSAAPGHGLTATEAEDARLKRACLETAGRSILLVSPEKLERSSVHRFGRIEDVSVLVTGATARPSHLEAFRAAGVQVVTVAPE